MNHRLIRAAEHIWYMNYGEETDRPNLGYVRGSRCALMFECGASASHIAQFRSLLAAENLRFADFAALSHWHWDHAMGMDALDSPVIACRETNRMLEAASRWEWSEEAVAARVASGEDILFCADMIRKEHGSLGTIPGFRTADVVFEEALDLDLGGVTCCLRHVGGPHSADSVVCFVPEDRFVFLSDSTGKDLFGKPWLYDPTHPELAGDAMDRIPYDAAVVAQYLQRLEAFAFDLCLKGHEILMSKEEMLRTFG